MRRVVHLSDLHFGTARPELLEPLIDAVNGIAPDLVAISGDLTQRARRGQFEEARAFIDRLASPWLAVPGNHDVPLDNMPLRLLYPWGGYKRSISRKLETDFHDAEMSVIGVNTVNPLAWQRGIIARHATRRVCKAFERETGERIRVVVLHHPLEHLPDERKQSMRGSGRAIRRMADCGAHVVLCGHLHAWRAEPFARRRVEGRTLQVQAGTGLSTRVRGEDNDFNLLTLEPGRIEIERFVAGDAARGFAPAARVGYRLDDARWVPLDQGSVEGV